MPCEVSCIVSVIRGREGSHSLALYLAMCMQTPRADHWMLHAEDTICVLLFDLCIMPPSCHRPAADPTAGSRE